MSKVNTVITLDDITNILEEKTYPVGYTLSTPVNINNSGTLNDSMLERARRAFIMETVGVWGNELVGMKQDYPKDDIADVTFDIDIVVLKRKDFDKLKGFYEQLLETREETVSEKA